MRRVFGLAVAALLAAVTLHAQAAPDPGAPEGRDDSFSYDVNQTGLLLNVSGNDGLNGGTATPPLSIQAQSGVAKGCFAACGSVTGFSGPNLIYNTGATTGTNSVWYYSQDSLGTTDIFSGPGDTIFCDSHPTGPSNQDDSCGIVTITTDYYADTPNLTVGGPFTIDEDTSRNLGISASLSDADGAETLSVVISGLPTGASLTDGTNSSSTASTDVSAWTLGSIKVTPAPDDHTDFTLTVTATSTTPNTLRTLSPDTASKAKTIDITVNAVNDAPVLTVPGARSIDEDTLTAIGGISVADVDADEGSPPYLTATLVVSKGRISLTRSGSAVITNNDSASVTVEGSVADVSGTIGSTKYRGNGNYNGADTLTVTADDGGNSGSGGVLTDVAAIGITVNAVNDDPSIADPGAQSVDEDQQLTVAPAITASDVDAGGSTATGSISVSNGIVTASGTAVFSGSGTSTISLSGTIAQISSALGTLEYTPSSNYNGSDTIVVTLNDGGNTGAGGGSDVVWNIPVTVNPVNDRPSVTVPGRKTLAEDVQTPITGISVADVDADDGTPPYLTVTLDVGNGTINVTQSGSAVITNNDSASVTVEGSVADVSGTVGSTEYTSDPNVYGSDTLTVTANDGGNTGSGGVLTKVKSVAITINSINDDPVISDPGAQTIDEDTQLTVSPVITASDVDAGSGMVTGTIHVSSGTVTASGTAVVSGSGTATINLSGKIAQISSALSTLKYQANANYYGSDTLVVTLNDGGNTGSGGAGNVVRNIGITVNSVNDAPTLTAPASKTLNEDTQTAIAGISVTDVDAGDAGSSNPKLTVTLAASNGTVSVTASGSAGVSNNNSAFVTVTGSVTDVSGTIGSTKYTSDGNYNGADTLTITASDTGNTGSGGTRTDVKNIAITVTAVNDAPVITVPGAKTVAEDVQTAIAGISVTDVDADAGSNPKLTVTLSVSRGTINVTQSGSAGISNNDTASVTVTGSVADVSGTIASTKYTSDSQYNGADTLSISANDTGNTGSGGTKTDLETVAITVTAVNDAPVITVPGAKTVSEDTQTAITGISVADADADDGTPPYLTVVLGASNGTINVTACGSAAVTANDSASVTVKGSVADVSATIATSKYTGNSNYNGADTLTVDASDTGNTGSSGTQTDSASVAITVSAVNDDPVISNPGAQSTNEDAELTVAPAISVSDVDAASGTVTGTVSVSNGTVTASGTGVASGSGTATINLSGTITEVSDALGTVKYQPGSNYNGADTLAIVVNDGGNTGTGGGGNMTRNIAVTVNALNDDPSFTVPGSPLAVNEDVQTSITGISVSDPDADDGTTPYLTVTLAVSNGTVNVTQFGSAVITSNDSSAVTVEGSVADVSNTIASAKYTSNSDFNGSDTLTLTANDGGNSGAGGGGNVVGTVDLTVDAVNDAPVLTLPGPKTLNEDQQTPITGVSVADVDAATVDALLTVTAGTINVTPGSATISAGSNDSATLTLSGSVSDVNTALATIKYTTNANVNGAAADSLSVTVDDNGGTGSGGEKSDSGSVTINVTAVNDAPVLSLPGTQSLTEDSQGSIGAITVTDVDAVTIDVVLTVTSGVIHVTPGSASISAGANDSATLTLTGSVANVNTALGSVKYTGDSNLNGTAADSMSVSVDDNGGTGTGGTLSDSGSITLDLTAQNDDPVIVVPGAQTLDEDVQTSITGISVADVDSASSNIDVTLAVSDGTVSVTLVGGASVGGGANGSASVTITGTAADVSSTIGTTKYTSNSNYSGTDTLTVTANDGGNTGAGGGGNVDDTVSITVTPVADTPNVAANDPVSGNENTPLALGISASLNDSDGSETLAVTISGAPSGATLDDGSNSHVSTGTGDVVDVSSWTLGSITVQSALNDSTDFVLTVTATATEAANSDTASASATINVLIANVAQAPGLSVTTPISTNEDVESPVLGIAATVTDTTPPLEDLQVVISGLPAGASISDGTNTSTTASTIVKSYDNSTSWALGSIRVIPPADDNTNFTLTVTATEAADYPTLSDVAITSKTIDVTVNAVNDAPVLTLPGAQSLNEDVQTAIAGISVADVDADDGSSPYLTVTLAVSHGTIHIAGGAAISNNDTATVTVTGAVADVSSTIGSLQYTSDLNYNSTLSGDDTLTVTASDTGNTGIGGTLTDVGTVAITVNQVNDDPVVTVPGAQTLDEDVQTAIGGISVADVDAEESGSSATKMTVTLGVNHGAVNVGGPAAVNNNDTASVTVSGTLSDVNTSLGTVQYTSDANYNSGLSGNDTLTVTANDGGNTGSGGGGDVVATVDITVSQVNDAPVLTVPGAQTLDEDVQTAINGISVADVDAEEPGSSATKLTLTLAVSNGTINVTGSATISNNDTATVIVSGSVADVNASLATVKYTSDSNYYGADTLTVTAGDNGNYGSGGVKSDMKTVAITVTPINDAPLLTVPGAQTIVEDTQTAITGISVADVDADAGSAPKLTVTLAVTQGTINVTLAGSASLTTSNDAATVTVEGSVADVSNTIATAKYTGDQHYYGGDTLTVTADDGGNTGGGTLTDVRTVAITVTAVNDAPVLTVPGAQTLDEDVQTAITGISVVDVDADDGSSPYLTATLAVSNGTINVTLAGSASLTTTNNAAAVTVQGSVADVSGTLGSVKYTSDTNYYGADTLTVTADDGGNTGGGTLTDVEAIAITVSPVNDGPVVTVPGAQAIVEDTQTAIAGISVADLDADSGTPPYLTVTLAVANGTINVTQSGSAGISNNDSALVTVTGSVADVSGTIGSAKYTSDLNYNGADTLTVVADDGGNTGGGSLTDSQDIAIAVSAVNDAPVLTVPGAQVLDEDVQTAITGISVVDVDADDGSSPSLTVTLAVSNGTINVTLAGSASLTTTNNAATVTVQGSVADVSGTLGSVKYTSDSDYYGTDTLTVTANDGGNSGAGGALTDVETIAITVDPVNDDPVITVPGATQTPDEEVQTAITGISVSDLDADAGVSPYLTATLAVGQGTIDVSGAATVTNNDTAAVTVQGSVADVSASFGTVKYTGDLDYYGPDTLTVTVTDAGNYGSGGGGNIVDTVAIDVQEINDAPVLTVPGAQTLNEDILTAITGISVADVDADAGSAPYLNLTMSVSHGTINVTPVGIVTVINNNTANVSVSGSVADVSGTIGSTKYQGDADYNGADTLAIGVSDNGNYGGGGTLNDSATIAITVTAVNDEPSFTAGADQVVGEDAGPQTIAGWATSISKGPADESVQTLTFNVTHDNVDGLFAVDPAIDAAGTLTYTPADNANGSATVTVVLADDGGTSNGGDDTFATQQFTITVNSVNDAPTVATPVGNFTVNEDAGNSVIDISSVFADVDIATNLDTLTLTVSNDTNAALFTSVTISGASASITGTTLTLDYAPDQNGSSDITLRAVDTQGGATADTTFTVTVDAVNDAPVLTVPGAQTLDEDVQTAIGGMSVADVDAEETGSTDPKLTVTLAVTSGVLNVSGAATISSNDTATVTISGAVADVSATLGSIKYRSNLDFNGNDTLTVTASDNGNYGSGGTLTDVQAVAITVTPVNDPPVLLATPADITVDEDAPTDNVDLTVLFDDVDIATNADVLTITVSTDNPTLFASTAITGSTASQVGTSLALDYAQDQNGTAVVTLRATDAQGPDYVETTFNVTVTAINDDPVVATPVTDVTVDEDSANTVIDISGVFSDVDIATNSDTVTILVSGNSNPTLFDSVSISGSAGGIIGTTLTLDYGLNQYGTALITLRGTDSFGQTITSSFNVTVNQINDAPTVNDQSYSIDENSTNGTVVGTVVSSDIEAFQTRTYAIDGTAFAIDPTTGIITVADSAQLDFETTATFVPTVTVTDNGTPPLNDTAAITITLLPLNDNVPVATDDSDTLDEGATLTTVSGALLANDTDADLPGDPLTTTLVAGPSHASAFTLNADGSFSYTHDDTESFTDSFTYQMNDPDFTSNIATVNLTITPVNDNTPVAVAGGGITVDEDAANTVVDLRDYFSDVDIDADGILDDTTAGDNDSLTFTLVSNSNASMVATSLLGYILTLDYQTNQNGTADVVIQATDNVGHTVTNTIAVTVNAVNDAPTLTGSIAPIVVDEDTPQIVLDYSALFADVDIATNGDFLTFHVVIDDMGDSWLATNLFTNPDLTFDTTSYTVTLPLEPDVSGSATLTITATDQGSPALSAGPLTVSITINQLIDDTPAAADDTITIDEDSDSIYIPVMDNDYIGDGPTEVTSAGSLYNISGQDQYWRSALGQSDPGNTGTTSPAPNGEVMCYNCPDSSPGSTLVSGSGLPTDVVWYKPRPDFHGTDSFTYTIQDVDGQTSSATVNITVNSVNDPPVSVPDVRYSMDQATTLIVPVEQGLRTQVFDRDNTNIDGSGCNPANPGCTDGDTLYIQITQAATANGSLIDAPYCCDGAFVFRPLAGFAGDDSFTFNVCDRPFGEVTDYANHCALGVVAHITVNSVSGAPEGSVEQIVEFDFQLAQRPLELPVPSLPNVLLLTDDSGSMAWDMVTDQSWGLYRYSNGRTLFYVFAASGGSGWWSYVAPPEELAQGEGVWRLRNSQYNKVYYDPSIRYTPWVGLDGNDVEYADAPPTNAPNDPADTATRHTNLTQPVSYTAYMPPSRQYVCRYVCSGRRRRRRCRTVCGWETTWGGSQTVSMYLPRYYNWVDRDGDGVIDGTPSPFDPDPVVAAQSEGVLVEIKPASQGGSDTYPKGTNRTDCTAQPGACTYTEELQNFANFFSYARSKEFLAKNALGKVVGSAENMRIGLAVFNHPNNNTPIMDMNESPLTGDKLALLRKIYGMTMGSSTPARSRLHAAGKYLACESGNIMGFAGSNPGDANCPVLANPEGNCQQNFTLLMTDGAWNGSSTGVGNTDGDNNTDFDGGRYADSYSSTLADVAMYWYERDMHPDLPDEVPTTPRDLDGADVSAFGANAGTTYQHMSTYVIAFGIEGSIAKEDVPRDYTQPFSWGSVSSTNGKLNDLLHASVNGRGDFLNASDPTQLQASLESAFEEFAEGVGTASAVSFNSQEIQQESLVFRAYYNVTQNTGDLVAQHFDENGLVPGLVWSAATQLDTRTYDNREILTMNSDTRTGIPLRMVNLSTDQFNAMVEDPTGTMTQAQKTAQVTDRVNYVRGDLSNERPAGVYRERPLVQGRLGDMVNSTPVFVGAPSRLRRNAVPYPQGKLYTEFRAQWLNRTPVVYVSANDGMFHGFNANTGDEVFAYVPNANIVGTTYSTKIVELLNYNYRHKYLVDLTPGINDAFIDPAGGQNKDWATVVVGGHGAGAKSYFALNLTDPANMDEAHAGNVVLWEFSDVDDTYPTDASGNPLTTISGGQRQDLLTPPKPVKDLGYTFSDPTVVMSNVKDADGENEWVAVFGNGFNSTAGIAKLYVLFINRGADGNWCHPDMIYNQNLGGDPMPSECVGKQDFVKLSTGFGVPTSGPNQGYPNGLGTPRGIDIDNNGTIDYAYAGDMFGNFYRFDLTSSDFNDWTVTKIFEATYDNAGTIETQPIVGQPLVVTHPTEPDGYIVIFTTGTYMTDPDRTDTHVQSLYGIWDRLGPVLIDKSDLVEQNYTNVIDATYGSVRILSNDAVDYSVSGGKMGWFNDLDPPAAGGIQDVDPPEFPGERAVRNIQSRGGLVFVNSIVPRGETSCTAEASGFALAFCPATGGTSCLGDKGIFDLNNDGLFDSQDEVTQGVVAATRFEDSVPTDSSFIGGSRVTQLSDQSLEIRGTDTSGSANTGRLSWRMLDEVF